MPAGPGRRSSPAWTDAGPVNAVREDPKKRGLLYASTEKGVYVSFDDGEQLAVAASEPAGQLDPGSDRQGRRPCRRGARPRVLDPRRHRAAASDAAVDSRRGRRALQARRRVARPLEPEHRHAVAEGRADIAESSRGHRDRLLPEVGFERTGHAGSAHGDGSARSALFEHRHTGADSGRLDRAGASLLVSPAAAAGGDRRHASVPLGSAVSAARRGRRRTRRPGHSGRSRSTAHQRRRRRSWLPAHTR